MNNPAGWVLYDDACGFCRRWIPFWAGTLQKRGFGISPLQSEWVVHRLNVSPEDLLYDLRLLLSDGTELSGANVYRYLMQRIWWAYPIYLLSVAPVLHKVFDWGYRTFADNRYHVSHACRLPGGGKRTPEDRPTRKTPQ
jgi:predicted DCC family thiol-disulfide oxidoreductase YuxK